MVKKFIDSTQCVKFGLVHRSLRDPRRKDEEYGPRALKLIPPNKNVQRRIKGKLSASQKDIIKDYLEPILNPDQECELDSKDGIYGREHAPEYTKRRGIHVKELEKEFGDIEVEEDATMHGINFPDVNEYDYLQYLKPITNLYVPLNNKQKDLNNEEYEVIGRISLESEVPKESELLKESESLENQEVHTDCSFDDNDSELRELKKALSDEEYIDSDATDNFFENLLHERGSSENLSGLDHILREEYADPPDLKIPEIQKPVKKPEIEQPEIEQPVIKQPALELPKLPEEIKNKILSMHSTEQYETIQILEPRKKEFDAVSILSLKSNLYNHPKIIQEHKSQKLREPIEFKNQSNNINANINKGAPRNPNETAEDKNMRKSALKEDKRKRKEYKKHLKTLYKAETKTQIALYQSAIATTGLRF